MKRKFYSMIAALLFIMPSFGETWVYKDWENEYGYLYNVYAYDTEEDFINSREADVLKETECSERTAKSLFGHKETFQKCATTKDTESLTKILKDGNYAYGMITWYESGWTYAQVIKLVNDTLYFAKYSAF